VSKVPVELIARLHGDGKTPSVIVQAVWKQTGTKMSVADIRTVTGALQAQSRELPPVGPLLDFIPTISPRFMKPRHLAPFIGQLEQIGKRPIRGVWHAPPRHSKPLGKDTRVTMADGSLRPISALRVGDRVVSGEGRITGVCGVYRQGLLPVVRVTTRSGRSFLAEGSHRFLTQRGWVRVDEFDLSDGIIAGRIGHRSSVTRLDPLASITPGGTEDCFCITVEHDESFLAEGLVTHNTELILHTVAHGLRNDPAGVYGYASYGQSLTFSKSTRCRDLTKAAGVRLSREAANEWRTTDGGGLLATSVGAGLIGQGVNRCMFIDDAYKNRVEAESKGIRNKIWDWFSDVVMTRIEPGASVIIFMVRWNQDDLAGRVLRERGKHKRGPNGERPCALDCPGCGPNPADGFEEISLPAIDLNGNALWPELWPIHELERRKREVTEYTWLSQYQGTPRQRGSNLFEGLTFYDPKEKPRSGFSISIGIDLSYTESTSADWAVAVVLMKWGTQCWVLEVVREQTTAPKFARTLKALRRKYKGAPMYSIYYGPEKGSIDFMRELGVPVKGLKRPGDKFVRAQGTAAAWNDGRICVPLGDEDEWLNPFIEVVSAFTGVKDDIDDDVDALVAAFEGSGMSVTEREETEPSPGGHLAMPGDDIGYGGGNLFG